MQSCGVWCWLDATFLVCAFFLLKLRNILARPAQPKGWSINSWSINSWPINSWQITGRSGGSPILAEQECSEGSSRFAGTGELTSLSIQKPVNSTSP